MKKYQKILLTCVILFFPSIGFAECVYEESLLDCKQKNIAGTPDLATDYLCVASTDDEEILYNIILDEKFSAIDKEAYDFLQWLDANKNYFFGTVTAESSYFQGIDIIGIKFRKRGEYWKQYQSYCDASNSTNGIAAETFACLKEIDPSPLNQNVSSDNIQDFFSSGNCMRLAETKLGIFEMVAFDVLKLNKTEVRKNNRKRFMQGQRQKYEGLLSAMRSNIGYMGRIAKKWTSKTINAF